MELSKVYNPKEVEDKIYQLWKKSGFFNPDKLPRRHKKPYCILLPPPNITGELHLGHALNALVQDILIRWKRMEGFKTLWLPGIDHAGIATQVKVERELKKEGLTRFDLGREEFLRKVWQWAEKYGKIILKQFKRMGCSLDWSRTKFTLDKDYCQAVKKAFFHYYKKGWIYQGKRPINWCPRCQTSLSDLEVEYEEKRGKLWYIKYPLTENSKSKIPNSKQVQNFIRVATTRPETMVGDIAIAVNPKDERYKNLIGKKAILPLVEREIPIIADPLVEPKFGTGAIKVTPAHHLVDYEISLRHNLPMIQVIDEKAKMTKEVPLPYQGLKVLEARKKVIKDLKDKNFLEKVEDYIVSIPKCYRCQTPLEILPSKQWFLRMKELAKLAIEAVKKREVQFIPKNWERIYFAWLKNIKDWCISRQIWWGHKIPLRGSQDVLDTWFSSALWPLATLGWPKKTKDLKNFYPTKVLSTDRGIINFWVTRMIFSGMEFMGKPPFRNVYIHATVLTREGKRMSKSLGTGVDPILLIEKFGADATRWGIAWQIREGQDIKFVEDNIVMGRKFCNKIWNASRFVLLQIRNSKFEIGNLKQIQNLKFKTKGDKKILKALKKIIKSVNKNLKSFRFGKAAQGLYDFFWHDFCDQYIEEAKKQLAEKPQPRIIGQTQKVLVYVLLNSLKLLHPFIPFITEEIYQKLPIKNKKRCLMVEEWPK